MFLLPLEFLNWSYGCNLLSLPCWAFLISRLGGSCPLVRSPQTGWHFQKDDLITSLCSQTLNASSWGGSAVVWTFLAWHPSPPTCLVATPRGVEGDDGHMHPETLGAEGLLAVGKDIGQQITSSNEVVTGFTSAALAWALRFCTTLTSLESILSYTLTGWGGLLVTGASSLQTELWHSPKEWCIFSCCHGISIIFYTWEGLQ